MTLPDRPFWNRFRVAVATVASAVLVLSLSRLFEYGPSPAVAFLFALGGVFALIFLADWVFPILGPPAWRLVRSLALSVGRAVLRDPELDAFMLRHPRLYRALRARLTLKRWSGFYLTAIVVLATGFLAGFYEIAEGALTGTEIAAYDPAIAALTRAFRTAAVTRVLWIATVFGNAGVMLAVTGVFVVLCVLWGRRAEALLVAVTLVTGAVTGDLIKLVGRRARPPAPFALIRTPESYSFPSGHALASLLFFALLAFVLLRVAGTTPRRRFAIVALSAFGALLVAGSRVYLAVHWPTDILGSWYLAAAWLSVTLGAFLAWERYAPGTKRWPPLWSHGHRVAVTAAVVAIALTALVAGAQADPLLERIAPTAAVEAPAR